MNARKSLLSTSGVCLLAFICSGLQTSGACGQALNPNNYATISSSLAPTGAITINTDTLQITGSGFTTVTGVTATQTNGGPTLAVFDFGSINISSSVTVSVTGSRPFALLSQGGATIAGTINISGGDGTAGANTGFGVAGGAPGGNGFLITSLPGSNNNYIPGNPGSGIGGGAGGTISTLGGQPNFGAAGGAFGGSGGRGGYNSDPAYAAPGGTSYGNLILSLQAGSGGGSSSIYTPSGSTNAVSTGGGGGGGAMQIGANGALSGSARLIANGGDGGCFASVGSGRKPRSG